MDSEFANAKLCIMSGLIEKMKNDFEIKDGMHVVNETMQDSLPSKLLHLIKRQIAASIRIFNVVLVTGSLGSLAINSTRRKGARFVTKTLIASSCA
jgi:hypothetical protein